MTLRLTPDILVACYEYLKTTRPFSGWKMPEADDIEFKVAGKVSNYFGWYDVGESAPHLIAVCTGKVKDTMGLMTTMAHEMVHLHQCEAGSHRPDEEEHNPEFHRLAQLVCKSHGFDFKTF